MELPNKLSEQIVFNKRPENEEHMLIVMDKSSHEESYLNPYKLTINNVKSLHLFNWL